MAPSAAAKAVPKGREIMKAEIVHLIHQSESLQELFPEEHFSRSTAGKAFTMQSPTRYGYKLNRTEDFGMSGPVKEDELLAIENEWQTSGLDPEIHISEHADVSALGLLSQYESTGSICSFYRPLGEPDDALTKSEHDTVEVTERTHANEVFVAASVEGFRSGERLPELLKLLAESAVRRADTRLFFAIVDGKLAGTAGMAVFDVDDHKYANLYIDSTSPPFRGMGVHRALLLVRLAAAKAAGCDFAIAAARTGSGSARNIEKVGFERAFMTTIYRKNSCC